MNKTGQIYCYLGKDYLGNVRITFSDRKEPNECDNLAAGWVATAMSVNNYYPFGSPMPERNSNLADYRFGFNGKENDNEVKGTGNSVDFGARIYDSRLGRWLSLDPLQAKYPGLSPYNFCANNPIMYVDPDGRKIIIHYQKDNGREGRFKVKNQGDVERLKNSSNQFLQNMYATITYNQASGNSEVDEAIDSKTRLHVFETDGDTYFERDMTAGQRSIYYNPYQALEVVDDDQYGIPMDERKGTGFLQTPALGFWHEARHFLNSTLNFKEWSQRTFTLFFERDKDRVYHNAEDKHVIDGPERNAAGNAGEPIRTNHLGIRRKVDGPTSTKVDDSKYKCRTVRDL